MFAARRETSNSSGDINIMFKTLITTADKILKTLKGGDKLSKVHKRELHRKLVRREYKKRAIKHFGNFKPINPFRW